VTVTVALAAATESGMWRMGLEPLTRVMV